MPYLFTMGHRISFLKLNYLIRELDTDKILEEANRLIEESEAVQYWSSFVNLPEIFSIAVQTSHYASNYMISYQNNHFKKIPDEAIKAIEKLKKECRELLNNSLLEKRFTLRFISLTTIYSGLLALGDKRDIEQGVNLLEDLLVLYQQVPFHSYIDPIYVNLICCSFCLHDYNKLNDFYKRYKKATRGKAVNIENDIILHGFYFAGKWLETGRTQYVKKMYETLLKTEKPNLRRTAKLLLQVIEYFNIPIELVKMK